MHSSAFRIETRLAELRLAGRRVRVEFASRSAPPLPSRAAVIRRQNIPARYIQSTYWETGRGRYRFWWSDAGTFDLDAARGHVRCHLTSNSSPTTVEEVLRGPVASFYLLQQGFEPLHAGAVILPGGCAAFLGAPGAGKSSLVAFLRKRGARFVSDDILPMRPHRKSARAYVGLPHIRLTPQALHALDWSGRAAWRTRWKATVPIQRNGPSGPFRISRLYVLDRQANSAGSRKADVRMSRLPPAEAFAALVAHSRNDSLNAAWRLRAQLRILGSLADSVPVQRLTYPSGFQRLDAVRRKILQDMQS